MNRSRQSENEPSGNYEESAQIRPHPPEEPPINASKRPVQLMQYSNQDNMDNNTEPSENLEDLEESQNEENKDMNTSNDKIPNHSWLDDLPPVIRPDEELHQELLKKRHEERYKKVFKICHCELEGILNYSFECINRRIEEKEKEKEKPKQKSKIKSKREEQKEENERYEKARKIRVLRTKFRNGFFTPEIVNQQRDPELLSTILQPFHTLSVQHYLHFQSNSYLSELSNDFNVSLSESHLEDPNPFFNTFVQKLYNLSEDFTKPFNNCGLLNFPFIVCVGGLSGGGRTTITQFMQKVFDAHIIQLKQIVQSGSNAKKKKGASPPVSPKESKQAENDETNPETPQEYFLKSSIVIKYSDDKIAVQQIVQEVKDHMDGKGFIIDGFPNNKGQFAALEKALAAAECNMKKSQESLSNRIGAQRQNSKAQFPSINGLIIALNNEEDTQRLIDPETGNVYKERFNMPGLADLIGVSPIDFQNIKNDIEKRLVNVTVPEIRILPPKQMQVYTQYEGIAKKTSECVVINHYNNLKELIELIDKYILSLFSKFPNLLPHQTDSNGVITQVFPPLQTVMQPTYLILPHQCFNAVTVWYSCLESFGKSLANQSNLVHTLDEKLDFVMNAAIERYQLLIGQKDERLEICNDFVKKNMNSSGNYKLTSLFRTIWDISLKIRGSNLKHIDEVIGKSGLIEMILELRESPKIFFIALVQRMLYVKWFYQTFEHLINGDKKKEEEKKAGNEEEEEEECKNESLADAKSEKESQTGKSKKDNKGKKDQSKKEPNKKDAKKDQNKKGGKNKQEKSETNETKIIEEEEEEDVKETFFDMLTSVESGIPNFDLNNPNSQSFDQQEFQEQINAEEPNVNVPSIDISKAQNSSDVPNTTRPVHPPDSSRKSNVKENEVNTERVEKKTATVAQNKPEKKVKIASNGVDYLLDHFINYCDTSEPKSSQIAFDVNGAFCELGIPPCQISASFDNIHKYAEEFFSYVGSQFEGNELLVEEAKSVILIFRQFMDLCKSKETLMLNAVYDLRDILTRYTYAKCTNEMEHFARQFRKLKQMLNPNANAEVENCITANLNSVHLSPPRTKRLNVTPIKTQRKEFSLSPARNSTATARSPRRINTSKNTASVRQGNTIRESIRIPSFRDSIANLDAPLFEFDVKHVSSGIRVLADIELTLERPVYVQDLLSSENLLKIAKCACEYHLFHVSGGHLLEAVRDSVFGQDEQAFLKFAFCMYILECVEKFDVPKFLLCFAHSREEEMEIMNLFKDSMCEMSEQYSEYQEIENQYEEIEEEEEEEAFIEEEDQV